MKTNLKLFLLAIACLVFTDVTAQTCPRERLENKIAETNKMLPVVAAKGVIYTQEYISGNSVYEVNEIDENYVSLAELRMMKKKMKRTLLMQYSIESNLMAYARMIVECKMDIVVKYISKQSGKSFSITLSNKDLLKCLNLENV